MSAAPAHGCARPLFLPVPPSPPPARRRGNALSGDRIVRQVAGIVAWNAAMRLRREFLGSADGSQDGQLGRVRRLEVLRRTHEAIVAATARELARDPSPMLAAGPTAVVAHSHQWFGDKVCELLAAHGFDIVERTDNAADALGAIVAEQPDLVLVGDRLAMMTGADLLADTALFSPLSVRVAQADDHHALQAAGAHTVLPRQVAPADIANDAARLVAAAGKVDAHA